MIKFSKCKWYLIYSGPLDYFSIKVYKKVFFCFYKYMGSIPFSDNIPSFKSKEEIDEFFTKKFDKEK